MRKYRDLLAGAVSNALCNIRKPILLVVKSNAMIDARVL